MSDQPEIVYGIPAIKTVLHLEDAKDRRIYYMLEKGYVHGAFKQGALWALSIPAYRRAVHGEAA